MYRLLMRQVGSASSHGNKLGIVLIEGWSRHEHFVQYNIAPFYIKSEVERSLSIKMNRPEDPRAEHYLEVQNVWPAVTSGKPPTLEPSSPGQPVPLQAQSESTLFNE